MCLLSVWWENTCSRVCGVTSWMLVCAVARYFGGYPTKQPPKFHRSQKIPHACTTLRYAVLCLLTYYAYLLCLLTMLTCLLCLLAVLTCYTVLCLLIVLACRPCLLCACLRWCPAPPHQTFAPHPTKLSHPTPPNFRTLPHQTSASLPPCPTLPYPLLCHAASCLICVLHEGL